MGRIFSPDDIAHRRIPSLDAFDRMRELAKTTITHGDEFIGAILCGSVLEGRHNHRSDIDLVVLYDDRTDRGVHDLRRIMRYACARHIPIQIIPVPHSLAKTTHHSIQPSFWVHLERCVEIGGVIKTNPLDLMAPLPVAPMDDVLRYIVRKLDKLQRGAIAWDTLSDVERCKLLEKALSSPMHTLRKLLWLRDDNHHTRYDESAGHALERYQALPPIRPAAQPMYATLTALMQINAGYSAAIQRFMADSTFTVEALLLQSPHDALSVEHVLDPARRFFHEALLELESIPTRPTPV